MDVHRAPRDRDHHQQLVRETALADIQQEIVKAERGVSIADLQAQSQIKQANAAAHWPKRCWA
ncbi:MAG: hypothetical protein HXY40_02880 [Chloroflexi bacterium]|nr:hypothetical protein [Chloroflexota bacterium]